VTLVDTGETTQTGGRLKRILSYVQDEKAFGFTYGDGVANIDVAALQRFHASHGRLATVTAVRPARRFGALKLDGDMVTEFVEKPEDDGGWINGGFFVLSPQVGDLVAGDATIWEREPLERLAARGELRAFIHDGFWHPLDTLRDKNFLEESWQSADPPWKVW